MVSNMTRIFLENNELDLTRGLSREITYAIDDLQNLDSKATSFSKTIVIPGTTRNNALLGNIFEFNNSNFTSSTAPNVNYNFDASRSAACRIEVNGLQIVKGIFRLTKILYIGNTVEYECAVFGELGGFISALGNKRLEDLDFSQYNHNYSIANITTSWNFAQAGSGYVYPHIDYGGYSTGKKNWQLGTFRPAFFLREYLQKIFANSGYTFEFPLMETTRFKSLIIPHNQKKLLRSTSNFVTATGGPTEVLYGAGIDPLIDPAVDKSTIPVFGTSTSNFTGSFQYIGANSISVRIRMDISGTTTSDTSQTFYIGIKDGSPNTYDISQFIRYETIFNTGSTIPESFSFSFDFTLTLNTNDIVQIYTCTEGPVSSSQAFNLVSTVSYFNISALSATLVEAQLNDPLTVNDLIPRNIFQKDLFTSVLKLFNLYVTEDKFVEKKLIIKPYVDFYDGTIEDWTDKMDRGKEISIMPMSEVNARYYNFKFKDDSDFFNEQYRKRYNEGYGNRIFDNGLEFAKDTETVEVIFSSTVLVGYGGEDKIYSTIFKQSNNVEEQVDSNIRILQAKRIDGVDTWHIQNAGGGGNLHNSTVYCYAGHFDDPDVPTNDINFGAPLELFFVLLSGGININQFNLYYSSYMAEVTDKDSRLLSASFKLNEIDIFNLDFAKYKHINGGLYRLSKVIDYDAGADNLTKCELLRVINTTY
jgi:hypothetical protein